MLFLSLMSLFAMPAWAQMVTGRILDQQSKEPIIGANVVNRVTHTGTITDFDGNFSLELSEPSELKISYVGYVTKFVKATPGESLTVYLEEDTQLLDNVVVVGYGTQKKANLTGAVSSVDVERALDSRPVTQLSKGLQGIVPGLDITFNSGSLKAEPKINIRGVGSVNGQSKPLILLDNVEIPDISFVNPDDIESISVLKDAASSSIYGSRAAFGVILITTKDGSKMKDNVSFTYSNNFGWNQPINMIEFAADPVAELRANLDARNRIGQVAETFGMYFDKLIPGIEKWQANYANNRKDNTMVYGEDWEIIDNRAYFYRIWDPNEEMLRNSAPMQIHNASLTGNNGKTSYNISIGYDKTNGLLKLADEESRQRISANVSLNTQVTDWLNVGVKTMFTEKKQKYPWAYQSYYFYYMRWGAYFPYGISDGGGPLGNEGKGEYFRHTTGFLDAAPTCTGTDQYNRLQGNMTAKLYKGLQFKTDFTYGYNNYREHGSGGAIKLNNFWASPFDYGYIYGPGSSDDQVRDRSVRIQNYNFNAYFDYALNLKKENNLLFLLGMNTDSYTYNMHYSERRNLLDPSMGEISAATGNQYVDSEHVDRASVGFFARANYNWKEKLLLEVNGRFDGSSQFPTGDKWGFFPSASIGYRISEEDFMKKIDPVVSDLKLRASYGSIGNQDVGSATDNRDFYTFATIMSSYNVNWIDAAGSKVTSVYNPSVVSSSMTWEKINTLDLGLDMGMLNNQIMVTFDWFQRENRDMLVPRMELPGVFGANEPLENAGTLRTRGVELQVNWNKQFGDWNVYATGTYSDAKSEITKWNNPSKLIDAYYEGKEWGEIWGFTTDRFINSSDNLEQVKEYQGHLYSGGFEPLPGDILYKDINGDGKLTTGTSSADDHGDLKRIGNSIPRHQYAIRLGASWNGIDAEVLFQGVGKRDIWATGDLYIPYYSRADVMYDHQMDYWTESNQDALYARPFPGNSAGRVSGLASGGNNYYPQTKYLVDASYLRVKNITLGYTLPNELTKKAYIQKFRIYVSGQNLLTHENMDVPMDPEINTGELINSGGFGRTEPFTRTWSFGFQITL